MERRGVGGGDAGENVETPEALFTAGERVKLQNVEWHQVAKLFFFSFYSLAFVKEDVN